MISFSKVVDTFSMEESKGELKTIFLHRNEVIRKNCWSLQIFVKGAIKMMLMNI